MAKKGLGCSLYLFCVILLNIDRIAGDCGVPLVLLRATTEGINGTSPVGTEVKYTCIEGYEFDSGFDNKTVTCLDSNSWSAISDCQKVSCPPLPTDGTLSSNDNEFGDVVVMSCTDIINLRVPGAPVGSSLTVTCGANKTWDYFDESNLQGCIQIACVNPMPNSRGSNEDEAIDSETTFICNYGHLYADDTYEKDFECNDNGDWEINGVTNWTCVARRCEDLINYHGLSHVVVQPKNHFVGDTVKIQCIDGHEFNDSSIEKKATCMANQTWSDIPFDCLAMYCPPVANISHANISSLDNQYPSIVNFTCISPNVFPDGSLWRVSQCNKFGKWSEKIPNCGDELAIGGEFESVTVNAKGAASFGIISMSLIGVMFVGVIVFDIVTFGKEIQLLKRNLNCIKAEEEEDLESLDGDVMMKGSSFSLGSGRVTPAASTVDLQYLNESKPSLLNAIKEEEAAKEQEIADKKNMIPRTRLLSAQTSIQRALKRVTTGPITRIVIPSPVKKNDFALSGLPLGSDNYGKVIELRPPSPIQEDDGSGSDYTDEEGEDSEEEEAVDTV